MNIPEFNYDITTEEEIEYSAADIPALEKHLKDIQDEIAELNLIIDAVYKGV